MRIDAKKLSLFLLASCVAYTGVSEIISYIRASVRFEQGKAKKKQRDSKKVSIPHIPADRANFILSLSAEDLVLAIKSNQVTSKEAVATYIQRAYTIGRELELTAEEPFEEALALAEERDRQTENRGRLHGLPVSIKDNIQQIGCHSSAGVVHQSLIPDDKNSHVVSVLLSEGAVPFVRSNIPQGLLWIETVCNIWGKAQNPWKTTHVTGGSSGGEAALVASRCSVIGIGSDIGGSIRTPASFCGVYGFKPTPQRVSKYKMRSVSPEQVEPLGLFVPPVCGPIGRCVEDLKFSSEVLFDTRKLDYFMDDLPFDQDVYKKTMNNKKLRIGYLTDIYYFESFPAIRRSILQCKEDLENQGHTLVPFEPANFKEGMDLFLKAYSSFGAAHMYKGLQGEAPMFYYKLSLFLWNHPYLKKLLIFYLKKSGNQRLAEYIDLPPTMSIQQTKQLYHKIREFIESLTEYWRNQDLDAVICPTLGITGVRHNTTPKVVTNMAFGFVWNIAQYPAGTLPVGFVTKADEEYISDYNDLITQRAKVVCKGNEGMPVGIQVITLPYQDEKLLGVMKQIEDIYKFHRFAM